VSLFLIGVQMAGAAARMTPTAWAWMIPGLLLVVVFVWWEKRAAEPIIPLHLFRNRVFAVCNVLGFISGTVMFGALLFIPEFFQLVQRVSPTISGFRMLPMLAGVLLTSITAGRLVSRLGRYKVFVIAGTAILATGVGLMTLAGVSTGAWAMSGMLFVVGLGMGLFMQILITSVQNAVPREYMGVGTASVTFFRTLGGAIGAAVLGAVLLLNERQSLPGYTARYGAGPAAADHAFVYGMNKAFLYALPAAVLAFLLSFLLREVRLRTAGPTSDQITAVDSEGSGLAVESVIG
jgi:MFS family permease